MNVLIIAAHPDDEVLGCGGTIARLSHEGARVSILILAQGLTSRPGFDPVTDSNSTWAIIPPDDVEKGLVADIRSGADGNARDGKPFKEL